MSATRYYNLDAYRYTRDLRDKCLSSFSYANILITCYDACITWLKDIYYNCNSFPPVNEVTLKTLVEAISSRHHLLQKNIKYYKRLYHTYYLVYEGYFVPRDAELEMAIECLMSIIDFWVQNADMDSLIQLYQFLVPNEPLTIKQRQDTLENRQYICKICSLNAVPKV